MVLDAVGGGGSLLDVGCANSYLIQKLTEWGRGWGLALECGGLDISERLIELARRRLPAWKDRFFLGNALYWEPENRFRYVCVKELDYVPKGRRREFFLHLLHRYVEKGGRLILGPWTELIGEPGMGEETTRWGACHERGMHVACAAAGRPCPGCEAKIRFSRENARAGLWRRRIDD